MGLADLHPARENGSFEGQGHLLSGLQIGGPADDRVFPLPVMDRAEGKMVALRQEAEKAKRPFRYRRDMPGRVFRPGSPRPDDDDA